MKTDKSIASAVRNLGAGIAAFRLSRNMGQDDVAAKAGIARSTLSRLEADETPTVDTLIRVMRVLGLGNRVATLVPDARPSPLDPRSAGKPRSRSRKPSREPGDDGKGGEPWTWRE